MVRLRCNTATAVEDYHIFNFSFIREPGDADIMPGSYFEIKSTNSENYQPGSIYTFDEVVH